MNMIILFILLTAWTSTFLFKLLFYGFIFFVFLSLILKIIKRTLYVEIDLFNNKFKIDFPKVIEEETEQEKREKYWISANKDKEILRYIKEKNPSLKIFSANEPLNEVEEWDYHDNVTYLSFDGKIYANRTLIWKGGGFTDWYIDTNGNVFVKMENYVAVVPKHPSWEEHDDENLVPFYIDNGDDGIDA